MSFIHSKERQKLDVLSLHRLVFTFHTKIRCFRNRFFELLLQILHTLQLLIARVRSFKSAVTEFHHDMKESDMMSFMFLHSIISVSTVSVV